MINQKKIEQGLHAIGIKEGMQLEVHSSLSSLGVVEGGAESVIKALINVITENGSIIMPSFPLSKAIELNDNDMSLGITSKKKWLIENHSERTDMGIIADTFCKYDGVMTGSGKHRFSAWGKNAEKYSDNLQHLIDDNGFALLVGVNILKLSAMHYVENNIPENIWPELFPPYNPKIQELYNQDEWFITTGNNPPYFKGWLKIQREAEEKKLIIKGKIENSNCMLFKVKDILSIYEKWLRNDIRKLFEI